MSISQGNLESSSFRVDRTALTIADEFDESDTKRWWWTQTAESRLRHIVALRNLNYGDRASAGLQRVLEIAEFPPR